MNLKGVLEQFSHTLLGTQTDINKETNQLQTNSLYVEPGDIFIALEGLTVDGHQFIPKAIENGANVIFCSKALAHYQPEIMYIYIDNLSEHVGDIARYYYDFPEKKLKFVGVTGTNGKTTITYLIEGLMQEKILRIGTVEYKLGDKIFPAPNTTPEPVELTRLFHLAVTENITWVVMEVSSHALALKRVYNMEFDIAIFSNLSKDHLDYHLTLDNYFAAKEKLFFMVKDSSNIIINTDDRYGQKLLEKFPKAYTISLDCATKDRDKCGIYTDLTGKIIGTELSGSDIEIGENGQVYGVLMPYFGQYNLFNLLSAVATLIKMGSSIESVLKKIPLLPQVPGRFELVKNSQGVMAVVDFAHTGDGLENILKTLKPLVTGKLITVFGAGGDRDKTKRPDMAKVVSKFSDYCIATSDNPRTETPLSILHDIEKGFLEEGIEKNRYQLIEEREAAIAYAASLAKLGDGILLAGKGHEVYQIIGRTKQHFSDREMLSKYLK